MKNKLIKFGLFGVGLGAGYFFSEAAIKWSFALGKTKAIRDEAKKMDEFFDALFKG